MKKLNIIYEDKFMVVIIKPCKLLTVANEKSNRTLYSEVYDYLHKKNQRVFVVHRLDFDTEGLVIFAKNQDIQKKLQNDWDNVIRKYVAIVHGSINQERVFEDFLAENKFLKTYVTKDKIKGKKAITKVAPLKYSKNYSIVDIKIETGRKNQIRTQLSENKTPIIGDKKYGQKDGFREMALMAYYLEFIHPVTKNKMILQCKYDKYLTLYEKINKI